MYKTVDLIMIPKDPKCMEIQQFLQQQDLHLRIRNVEERPLNYDEIARLIRHLKLQHFLNTSSEIYAKKKMEESLPGRDEVIELMAADNDLLKKPIIVAGRLMVVGANRSKIMEMLQIKSNGSNPNEKRASLNVKKRLN